MHKKGNPKIISSENSISIEMIFVNKENSYKCEKQISEYFKSQFSLFIREAGEAVTLFREGININNISIYNEEQEQSEIFKEVIQQLDEKTINTLKLQSLLNNNYYTSNFNAEKIDEYFFMINNIENFQFSSSINSNSISGLEKIQFEILFLLISLLLILIVYRKKIEIYFNKIKNKL